MNPTLAAEDLTLTSGTQGPDLVLRVLASRSKHSARQLSAPASEVFSGIRDAVDQLLSSAIEARNAAEFDQIFSAAFPKYTSITLSLSAFANAMVPTDTINRMARESICEMESDFRDKA